MAARIRSPGLAVALGLSLAFLLPLLCGYAGRTGLGVRCARGGSPAVYQWAILTAEDGRVRLWVEAGPPPKVPPGAKVRGFAIDWYPVRPLRFPGPSRSVWEFDAHSLKLPAGSAFILAFPSWCAIAVCLVAPGIWFARRRVPPGDRGFSVEIATLSPHGAKL